MEARERMKRNLLDELTEQTTKLVVSQEKTLTAKTLKVLQTLTMEMALLRASMKKKDNDALVLKTIDSSLTIQMATIMY